MRPFSIWQSSCPEPTALAITPQGAGCQAKDRRGQAVVLWRFDFVMLNIVPLRPKPPCGRGRNFIHPQTYFSDLRSASKASFETPGEYASLPFVRKRRYAPHPPPKGHACLISMRQHAAFGPPPWWGGSTLRVELRGKTRRQAVARIRNALLNFIIAIIPQIEF